MSVFFSVLMLFTFSYSVVILLHWYGWTKKSRKKSLAGAVEGVSVLIAFRNEATHLLACVQALRELKSLDFPYEFIFVDDHSDDNSIALLEAEELANAQLLRLSNTSGKKAAISKGVAAARYSYILLLDADSAVPKTWLQSMLECAVSGGFQAIGGLVKFKEEAGFLNKFLNIEMCSLMGITAGGINMGFPVLANGTNFLFRKDAFVAVNGYEGDNFASGDDVFLLQKITQKFGAKSVGFNSEPNAMVQTQAALRMNDLLQQRVRWAGKSKGYRLSAKIFTALIGLYNVLIATVLLCTLFFPYLLPFVLTMFLCKMMMDAVLTIPVVLRTQQQYLLPYLPLVGLLYPFYIALTAAAVLLLKPQWKGRTIENV